MWKRSSTTLAARLADDSADAGVAVGNLTVSARDVEEEVVLVLRSLRFPRESPITPGRTGNP
jgi:hypothetical protein